MTTTTFFRLLHSPDKATALADAIADLGAGQPTNGLTYQADPQSFRQIPGSPFAYWVSEALRRKFSELPPFERDGRRVRSTNPLNADFRFFRCSWEVPAGCVGRGSGWVPLAKGGEFGPFYSDIHLLAAWDERARTYKSFEGTVNRPLQRPASLDFFFRPGITWPRRSNGLSMRALPAGCIFGDKGPAAFVDTNGYDQLFRLVAITNSRAFLALLRVMLARVSLAQGFEVGLIQSTPVPNLDNPPNEVLGKHAAACIDIKRSLDTANETSHAFTLPALLQVQGACLADRAAAWQARVEETQVELARRQREIDDIAYRLYGIADEDRRAIEASLGTEAVELAEMAGDDDGDVAAAPTGDRRALSAELLSYALGCAFGRWDARIARDPSLAPGLQGPFDPLPVCSPGMLVGPDGLPATSHDADYPLSIPWDGILVDDPDHPSDIVRRVRAVLALLWPAGAEAEGVERETCAALGIRELREHVAKPTNFFADHLKRYSKSRRQAPIYWPLSTASGSLTLWLYYHRLSSDTLFTAVNRYVDPKLEQVRRRAADLRGRLDAASGREATSLRDQHERAAAFLRELEEFRAELVRVAGLPYRPDLDDGVIINAAPLHRLFRQREWAKATRECWLKLQRGDYDWAHLASTLWPERVRQKCLTDKSLAIAHGREDLYQEASPLPAEGRGRRPGARTRQ